jgi:predicted GH43/DUF377 family glycosyl hydrolase
MKYLSIILIFLCALSFNNSSAQVNWTKYGNPVFTPGSLGDWDASIGPFCVVLIDSMYHAWYSGSNGIISGIGHATSSDGITWMRDENNPLIGQGPDNSWEDAYIGSPYVIFDGITYHMWYVGYDGDFYRIGYVSSSDGVSWEKYDGNPVIDKGPAESWESISVFPDCIYFDGSTFHMWYGGDNGIYPKIGYASSDDGIVWTKYESNPILTGDSDWDPWIGSPHVLFHNNKYHMWFTGNNDRLTWQWDGIGYAQSDDGKSWTEYTGNPVLKPAPDAEEWDSQFVGFCRVLWDSTTSQIKMWYGGGNSDESGGIGYVYSTSGDTLPDITGFQDVIISNLPTKYVLYQNYPNPFNPSTTIDFTLPKSEYVELKVYNILGKEVTTLVLNKLNQGNHTYTFDGKNLASGIYYYQLVAGEYRDVKKMIILK